MRDSDYYGDKSKWFIGVVKDVSDPLQSNRVRVRIKGIHPDEGDEDAISPIMSVPGTASPGSAPNVLGVTKWDGDLPNAGQIAGKISQHYTLRDLTVGAAGHWSSTSSAMGIKNGLLTEEIIRNLSNLSVNCLDPIKEHFGHLTINSGWRLGYSSADKSASGGNHPRGYAADICVNRSNVGQLAEWISQNLRGRFNMMLIYPTFVHIQLGGNSNQGSLTSPVIKGGKSRGVA